MLRFAFSQDDLVLVGMLAKFLPHEVHVLHIEPKSFQASPPTDLLLSVKCSFLFNTCPQKQDG